jgi:hypothetical protein
MKTLWLIALLSGCETIEAGKYAPDPNYPDMGGSDSGDPDGGAIDCEDEAAVSWINFGQGFFIENCFGCHHAETPDRYGAPEEILFSHVDDVWDQKGMVLMVSAGANPTMPPNGGTTDLDRRKLEIWLTCGEPGH